MSPHLHGMPFNAQSLLTTEILKSVNPECIAAVIKKEGQKAFLFWKQCWVLFVEGFVSPERYYILMIMEKKQSHTVQKKTLWLILQSAFSLLTSEGIYGCWCRKMTAVAVIPFFKPFISRLPDWTTGAEDLPPQPKAAECCAVSDKVPAVSVGRDLKWRHGKAFKQLLSLAPTEAVSEVKCPRKGRSDQCQKVAGRAVHWHYTCLQTGSGVNHNKQACFFFFLNSCIKIFPKPVRTAQQNAWYFVMLNRLTLNGTRNLIGSFIRLQWKHKVFNTKNVSTTFWDFFHFGTAAPWQIAKERNAVAAARCCGTSAPVCVPTPCTAWQPLAGLLSFLQPVASLPPLASPLPLLFLLLWKWANAFAFLWGGSLLLRGSWRAIMLPENVCLDFSLVEKEHLGAIFSNSSTITELFITVH